jgi:SAM-dependent methyltransferase
VNASDAVAHCTPLPAGRRAPFFVVSQIGMGFYNDRIVQHLVRVAMRQQKLLPYRERATSAAKGEVLEIGVGSGVNLPLYGEPVGHVVGIEPSPRLLSMAKATATEARRPVTLLEGSAERIPLADHAVDTVVTTWTLCSIPDVRRALQEMRRVLKPNGRLLFVEHGRSPDRRVRHWQDRLTPLWKRIGGGCHLNRPIDELIDQATERRCLSRIRWRVLADRSRNHCRRRLFTAPAPAVALV